MANPALSRISRRLLKTIPNKAKQAARASLEASANEIVAEMKRRAPVDTGDLQMSISWTWGDAPKGAMTIGRSRKASDGLRITIYAGGNDEFYAWFVEFGTQNALPKQFFFPTWRQYRTKAKRRLTTAIRKVVKGS
jgi:HK97 gp10 family phage protein